MALYLIGDVQGCDGALERLLTLVDFSPSRDELVVLGDLVNRGPGSLAALRRLVGMQGAGQCLLGNHDLHLLAVAHGLKKPHRNDTVADILRASDREVLLDWLRQRPLAMSARGWLLVHAGVLPHWDAARTLALAGEVQQALQADPATFLRDMYGNTPDRWTDTLQGPDRWRVVVNALTRLRFCSADGTMEFDTKDSADGAPPGFMPWFRVPGRRTAAERVAFGHWSTLGLLNEPGLLGLDTGCVWGGALSAARLNGRGEVQEVLKVDCPQMQRPGRPGR